jgi:thioredoxin reductase
MITISAWYITVLVIGVGASGFTAGLFHERWNWNKLLINKKLVRGPGTIAPQDEDA